VAPEEARCLRSPASTAGHWVALLALPMLLTAAIPDWIYSQTDAIDPWVYHGFFRHLEAYATTMFPRTYYGSRLGWIVPGYVAYHLFSPVVANAILHLTYYGTAVCSLYWIARSTAGTANAIFTTFAFGLYLPVIRAFGSDYVDGPVIAYALLAAALGMHGVNHERRWATLVSGMAIGAMLNSNVGAVALLPPVLVLLAPRPGSVKRWKPLVVQAGLWGMGIALCTTVLSAISIAIGGEWDFFLTSFRWMQGQILTKLWDVTGVSWVAASPWVLLPISTLMATVIVLIFPRRRVHLTFHQLRAFASLGVCIAAFAVRDFVGPGSLFYWPFYTSWLAPWSFIAIGAIHDPGTGPASARPTTELVVLPLSVCAIVFSLAWPERVQLPLPVLAGFGVTVALLAVAAFARAAVLSRLFVATALVFLHGWLSATPYYGRKMDRAEGFHAIDRGVRIIERYVTVDRPRFLLAAPRKLGRYVEGLTSVYLHGFTIAADRFPSVTPKQAAEISSGLIVIVIAEDENAAAEFDNVFAPYGLRGEVKGTERLDTGQGPLFMTFLEAKTLPGKPAS
jgi:hypothetical protein